MSVVRKSTPATSRPMAFAARTAISRLSGCTMSVTSDGGAARAEVARRAEVHDLALLGHGVLRRSPSAPGGAAPDGRTRGASAPSRARCRAAGPGSRSSTSSSMVCAPSPTTWPGTRFATAISSPFTTSMRWSKPSMKLSTMTVRWCSRAFWKATRTCSSVFEADRDAAAVVRFERLHDHGVADALAPRAPRCPRA